jgi:hypothetical protein
VYLGSAAKSAFIEKVLADGVRRRLDHGNS